MWRTPMTHLDDDWQWSKFAIILNVNNVSFVVHYYTIWRTVYWMYILPHPRLQRQLPLKQVLASIGMRSEWAGRRPRRTSASSGPDTVIARHPWPVDFLQGSYVGENFFGTFNFDLSGHVYLYVIYYGSKSTIWLYIWSVQCVVNVQWLFKRLFDKVRWFSLFTTDTLVWQLRLGGL